MEWDRHWLRIQGMKTRKTSFDVLDQLGALRRYAMSLVRSPDEAEDLVQDALVRAYEKQGTFRTGGNLRTWLMSIVHNAHVDRLRRGRSRAARENVVASLAPEVMAAPQDVSLRLKQLQVAFFALPEDQRAALHLVAIEDLSYQEAADALGVPVGTLMSRVSRARARLRAFEDEATGRSDTPSSPHLKLVGGSGDEHG
jgi:RNA polymerase sigma-70 factor, ECF subfamily